MKKVFVAEIKERDWIESPFLVRDKITAMAKNGKPYLTLKLIDRTGEVEGRVWDRVDEFAGRFDKDDFLLVQGKASVYMGKMQLVVQDLERLDESQIEMADYLPVSSREREAMLADLRAKVASMTDPALQALMESFLGDGPFLEQFATAPAAKAMHHVFLGGLLEHSLAVADLAEDVCARYPGLNRDLLLVGALLHDVGKVEELCYARSFDYSDEGKLLGHIVMGVEMVERRIREIPDFPVKTAILLKHLLLSHHGQYEYGSPKRPKTLEAVILNFLDDLDSKINGVRTHMEKEPDRTSPWTNYHRLYDRYFFKDSAPETEDGRGRVTPSAPAPAAPSREAVVAAKSSPPDSKPKERPLRKAAFGFSLGDQLKGKSLDLFAADDEKKE